MLFFRKKYSSALNLEISGLLLEHPVGLLYNGKKLKIQRPRPSFLTLYPPQGEEILPWIVGLRAQYKEMLLAVNINTDIVRSFSLVYDFADLIIVDPAAPGGNGTPDVSDITDLMDELLSLRLCYERYTPIFVRIPAGLEPAEIHPLLDYCRLSGIDGIVVPGVQKLLQARAYTQERLPMIASVESFDDALQLASDRIPVETRLFSPLLRQKLLKTLEKQVSNHA